jgi:hypothetical protein
MLSFLRNEPLSWLIGSLIIGIVVLGACAPDYDTDSTLKVENLGNNGDFRMYKIEGVTCILYGGNRPGSGISCDWQGADR